MNLSWNRAWRSLVLGAALLTGACGGGDSAPGSGDGELAGPWHRTAVGSSDTCGAGSVGMMMDGILEVSHTGTSLAVEYQDICNELLPVHGSGSFMGSVVMVSASLPRICRDLPTVGNCCYDAVQTDTGMPQGDSIIGETVIALTLAPSQPNPLCDPSSNCELRGDLVWERCPPADCSFMTCGPASPAPDPGAAGARAVL